MWSLIPRNRQVAVLVIAAVAILFVLNSAFAYFTGQQAGLFQFVSVAVTILVVGVAYFAERIWLWLTKFSVIQRKTFPNLNGVWKGDLHSTWKDPITGESPGPIPATFTIKQGLYSVHVSVTTEKAGSVSTRWFLEPDYQLGRFRIWYSYSHDPDALAKVENPRHDGVAWLEMDLDAGSNALYGQYYTDRLTAGRITLTRVSKNTTVVSNLASATTT